MSINAKNLRGTNTLHIAPSGELFVSEGWFDHPSVMMRSLVDDHRMNGAMTCHNYDGFAYVGDQSDPEELKQVIVELVRLNDKQRIEHEDHMERALNIASKYADLSEKYSVIQNQLFEAHST